MLFSFMRRNMMMLLRLNFWARVAWRWDEQEEASHQARYCSSWMMSNAFHTRCLLFRDSFIHFEIPTENNLW